MKQGIFGIVIAGLIIVLAMSFVFISILINRLALDEAEIARLKDINWSDIQFCRQFIENYANVQSEQWDLGDHVSNLIFLSETNRIILERAKQMSPEELEIVARTANGAVFLGIEHGKDVAIAFDVPWIDEEKEREQLIRKYPEKYKAVKQIVNSCGYKYK
jgi:hypothetical protein